jgi:PAS domain S-box-containing protein
MINKMIKFKFGNISINSLLMIILSSIIIAVSFIYYTYTKESHIRTYKEGISLSHNTVLKYIKSGFEQGFSYNDYGFFREIYNWILNDKQIIFLALYGNDSLLIRKIPHGFKQDFDYLELDKNNNVFSSELPFIVRKIQVKLKNEVFTVFVGFSSVDFIKAENRIFREVGLRAILVLIIGILIALIISSSLSGPIIKLTDTAKSIADGDMNIRANENFGGREFRQLAMYFNNMIEKIIESQDRLVAEMSKHNEEVNHQNRILEKANNDLHTEINERIKAETALKESERLINSIIDTTPAALAYINSDGLYMHVNEFWANIAGLDKNVIVGSDSRKTFGNIPIELFFESDGRLFFNREVSIKINGTPKTFIFYISPHYSSGNEVLGKVLFMVDVTQLKEYEKEILKSREEAVVANKHKSDFLASMSHEIRTPMNAIIGFSELLQNRLKNSKNLEYLNSIISSSRNLLKIINDILDLSKIEANKFELQLESSDIRNVIFDIEQIFSIRVLQKGLILSSKIDENIPPALLIDESRIRQILLNIVGNSVKFTSSGSIEIFVRAEKINQSKKSMDLIVDVVDSGVGIAEAELLRIFEAFHQPDDQKLKTYGGTGLGLTISKKLVEMMKGNIFVESKLNKGTKFTIKIPDIRITEYKPTAKDLISADSKTTLDFKKARLLIVDDIENNRRLIAELLKLNNVEIFEAVSGEDALEKINDISPDLVMLDMKMPDMNGYECSQKIKELHTFKKVPVILISASTMKSDENAIFSNFDDYLLKPVIRADLHRVMKRFLNYETKSDVMSINKSEEQIPFFDINILDFNIIQGIQGDELLKLMENKYWTAKETLKETLMLSELQSFAKDIIECGEKYSEDSIIFYGNDLLRYCDNLDFEKILEYLNNYDSLLDKLRQHIYGRIE